MKPPPIFTSLCAETRLPCGNGGAVARAESSASKYDLFYASGRQMAVYIANVTLNMRWQLAHIRKMLVVMEERQNLSENRKNWRIMCLGGHHGLGLSGRFDVCMMRAFVLGDQSKLGYDE